MKPFKRQEIDVENKSIEALTRRWGQDIVCLKNSFRHQQDTRARADYFFCFFGYFVAVEFKKENFKTTNREHLQAYELMRIRRANGFSFFSDSVYKTLQSFEDIYKIIKNKA